MSDAISPLPFHADDLELLSLEELSLQLRVSRAFIRACLDAGCPTRAGRLSAAELLHWLFEHYGDVRALVGLREFAGVEGVPAATASRLKMGNALLTLLEFAESRASQKEAKAHLRGVQWTVERALERA
jgi:hypothetical protein